MKVYIVEYNTWSWSKIEKLFLNKEKATKYANEKEEEREAKGNGDGYIAYHVKEYEVEE